MLDILRLRVLAAIAAHGSVTKAAKHLNYSQPAVSHHLARLEAETGARLVQRVGRGIRLTPEGEHLARRAAEIVGRVDAAAAELAAMVGLRTGRVRVAGFQSALAALVPHAAATLRRDHPGIELHLIDAHPRVALDLLRRRAGRRRGRLPLRRHDARTTSAPPTCSTTRCTCSASNPARHWPTTATPPGSRAARTAAASSSRRATRPGFTPRIAYTSDDIIVQQALVAAGHGRDHHAGAGPAHPPRGRDRGQPRCRDFRRRVYLATYGDPPDPPGDHGVHRAHCSTPSSRSAAASRHPPSRATVDGA